MLANATPPLEVNARHNERDILFQRIRDEGQDFLVFIQEQTRGQMSQSLIGESRRGEELDALYLTKVRPLPQGE